MKLKKTNSPGKATKSKPSGVSLKESAASKPPRNIVPNVRKYDQRSLEAFDKLFSGYEMVDGSHLPPLERCGISLEGPTSSGKSSLISGNERLIILKCYDGRIVLPRCRAKVINCPDFQTFTKAMNDLLAIAKRQGKDSPFCQIAIDPLSRVVSWKAQEKVDLYNAKAYGTDGTLLPSRAKGYLIESASDMDGYGPWGGIADYIDNLLCRIGELNWGWIAVCHYQWKAKPNFRGGMEWFPNIPATTADRVRKLADVRMRTERLSDEYFIHYDNKSAEELGSRIPLRGSTQLLDYLDDETPHGITSWDIIKQDFEEACKQLWRDSKRFKEEHKKILSKLKEIVME